MKHFLIISSLFLVGQSFTIGEKCSGIGQAPHPESCSKFFECNGIWEEKTCPLGTLFDIRESKCKSEYIAECSPSKTVVKRHYHVHGKHCNHQHQPPNIYNQNYQRPTEDVREDPTKLSQQYPGQSCYLGPRYQDHLASHPHSCSKFLRCVYSMWIEEDCQEGLHFNLQKNMC